MPGTEWPIIFSTPMVCAILDGRKTQTRRLPTPTWHAIVKHHADGVECRLWVRETWGVAPKWDSHHLDAAWSDSVLYREEDGPGRPIFDRRQRWRSSIHMPRWASRITLRVKGMRLVRLHGITSADAIAEGCPAHANSMTIDCDTPDPRGDFARLWNTLHTKPGTRWEDNPEVYRIAFEL